MNIDEEIDKIRKKFNYINNNFIDEKFGSIRLDISFAKDFEKLLNYTDKLEKENKELKELAGFTTIRIKTDDIKMLTKDFVSKDKIRAKIKEEKKRQSYIISMYAIGILEELLEE